MGEVYLADDLKLDHKVALKFLPPEVESDEYRLKLLFDEVKVALQISHPNACRVFDLGEADGVHFLSMEYIDGEDLLSLLRRIGRLPWEKAVELGSQACEGLAAAHDAGILHRDLKPANLMIDGQGRAKITDFGLAALSDTISGAAVRSGTPAYMAPEQLAGTEVTVQSDLYALGLLLYELFTGRRAFAATSLAELTRMHREEAPKPPSEWVEGFDPAVERILLQCLEKDPKARPGSAREVAEALVGGAGVAEGARIATLLLSELVGSSNLVERSGDAASGELFQRHDRLARDLLETHGGREIDKTDGFLLLFDRPWQAVRYALDYHHALAELSQSEAIELKARVGIHLGEIVLRRNPSQDVARGAKPFEVEGLAKPTAARLMSLSGGRQTLMTQAAFDLARRSAVGSAEGAEHLQWLAHGSYLFQGVEEPVEVFEVGAEGVAPLTAPEGSEKVARVADEDTILGWRPAPGLEIPNRPLWLLEEKLGEGGFGEVWLGRHKKSGDQRVYKFCYEAGRLRSLQREITVFRLLKEELGLRDDIARILDWNLEEAPYFIEFVHLEGGNLVDWADAQGGLAELPLADRLEIVAQVATAMAAAHSVGVLHKDIKPANVLMTRNAEGGPQAVLTDFGIGLVTDRGRLESKGITVLGLTELDTGTDSASTAGTRIYMAPELLAGQPSTIQADIYALGVMLYQVAVGQLDRPMAQGWERQVDDEILREDIAACVDGNPRRRPGNADEVAERLRSLEERRVERESERRAREEAERTREALERTRRQRKAAAAILVLLFGFGAVVSTLWRQAAKARDQAEAARLYVLGMLERDSSLGGALAYALASLEIADDPDTRLFALEVLWRSPTAVIVPSRFFALGVEFSPDGNWLAAATLRKGLKLWPRSGGEARTLGGPEDAFAGPLVFAQGSRLLAAPCIKHELIHILSVPEGELVRSIEAEWEPLRDWLTTTDDAELVTIEEESDGGFLARSWPLPQGEPSVLGRFEKTDRSHGSGEWLVSHEGSSIFGRRLDALQAPERLLGWHEEAVATVAFSPDGRWMASGDRSGEVRVWSLASRPQSPLRTMSGDGGSAIRDLAFDPTGRWLAVAVIAGATQIWDLEGPPAADPLVLSAREMQVNTVAFDPNGEWVVTAGEGMRLWPLGRRYSHVLRGHEAMTFGLDFAPDGSWVASSSADATMRVWPLTQVEGPASRVVYKAPPGISAVMGIAVDPASRFILTALSGNGGTWLVPLGDGEPRPLEGFEEQAWHVGLSSDGRFAAAADGLFNGADGVIRVWDLETGGVRILDRGEGNRGNTQHLDFTPENRLVSGGHGSVRSWNIEDGTFDTLREGMGEKPWVASGLSPDGRFLASFANGDEHPLFHDLESGDTWELPSHGEAFELIIDAAGEMLVTATYPVGELRAGPVTGEEAHRLLGHEGEVWQIAFSPDGRWIGSVGRDSTVRLWPRPEGEPFHTLPYDELLDRLRALTNLRAVPDEEARGGYRLEAGPFPGWETAPVW